ncbi:MAG: dihydrolipoamide dehydrogenase [Gaiellales bacterium]|nr:dihydrolipoamide dehydrogenase [Gaiellales bacterium]
MECDLVVLGSGPGGYPAAIRAAQLGASVIIVEQADTVGGTCLNVGCIPTKAMVQSAHAYNDAQGHFAQLGVRLGGIDLDFEQVQSNRRGIVDGVVKGLAGLLKTNGIQIVKGRGSFTGPNTLAVEGGEDVQFKSAVIATGSRSAAPPIPGIDRPRCIDSTGALEMDAVPRRLAILGGGVIGVEFASIYAQFGSAVTVVEMLPNLIGNEDEDAVSALERAFRRRGIGVETGARATGVEERDGDLALQYETEKGESKELIADVVLVATGRVANVEDIGLEAAGVSGERRRIPADSHMRTNVPHIYAAGDVAGNWQLAHTAFREGEVAAENALGHDSEIDYRSTPRCVYTDPEIASVGLSELQAREQHGDEVVTGTMPYAAIARAAMYGDRTGFVKVIGESRYGELLGVVAVGTQATELIEAGVVAIEAEGTLETVGDSIAAHPTLGEAVKEAALVALGRPLHVPVPKKR